MTLAVVITARPSYARIKTALVALQARGVDLRLIAAGSALLERYGRVVDVIRADGFPVTTEIYSTHEGSTLVTSAKESGALTMELAPVLERMRPDAVLVIADRHEVLSAAQAAAYLHLPLVHVQGGEQTGSIDDDVRDAISQLASIHLVATTRAKHRVYGLTGAWGAIHVTGCPSVDLALASRDTPAVTIQELGGSGGSVAFESRGDGFVVLLQHPVTSEAGDAAAHYRITLAACADWPVIAFWPGQDAGGESASKVLRLHPRVHTVRNLPPLRFLRLLQQCACLVGNSSVGIRECSALGVPVVNIGTRQHGRERGPNVVDVGHGVGAIRAAIANQIAVGRYRPSTLYGDGHAGERIAEVLCAGLGHHPGAG